MALQNLKKFSDRRYLINIENPKLKNHFIDYLQRTNNEAKLFLSRSGKIIIRMRGLPFEANSKDVKDFFENGDNSCQIVDGESGVLFVHYPDGRATGDAFVMFKDEEEISKALLKHKAMMGSRYIELFRSTSAEVHQVLKRSQDPKYYQNNLKDIQASAALPILPPEMITGNRKDCIRLRNLPVECGVEQILEFLGIHSQHIVHQGCHMIFNAQGQPSGEAFIQFDSELSSYNASSHKNGKCMFFSGKKYFIEVIQCSGEEMNLVLLGLLPSNLINVQHSIPSVPNNQSINANLNSNSYFLYNQLPGNSNQTNISAPSFYYQPNTLANSNQQTRQLNNPQIQASQFFQPNTLIPNSTLSSQIITPNQYSNYPPQIFYYLTPPVSPTSTVFLQQNIPSLVTHHPYQPNQLPQFNGKFILPTIEFVKLILKGLPISITPYEVIEFLKDCGEILPELIQIQNSDSYPNMLDVIVTCERNVAERILIEKNHQKLGNNIVEVYQTI